MRSDRQIRALYITGRNILLAWIAYNCALLNRSALSRAVALSILFRLPKRAIELYQHRIIYVRAKCILDSLEIAARILRDAAPEGMQR